VATNYQSKKNSEIPYVENIQNGHFSLEQSDMGNSLELQESCYQEQIVTD